MRQRPTTTTFALLGLLAIRPWTGYELTRQARRSLRYAWPSSEAHLYREQKRLVQLGWAKLEREAVGQRTRNRYEITVDGREALRLWLDTPPAGPRLEIEGLVRTFFGDAGSPEALRRSMQVTAAEARVARDDLVALVEDYLETGGPFPQRLHVIAMSADLITDLLGRISGFFEEADAEVASWSSTEDLGMTKATLGRLESIAQRATRARRADQPV
ncbi:MAG TPA: PadR family transcriptional regulator [Acidimicrobiia bacterium]|nr:PadR family transcriptional regulator [Acidimicrobiia bacterium]